jgi:hypothetical protein
MAFFGITAIAAGREMKARRDFKMVLFGGTYNVYRYYKHLKANKERFSAGFTLFLLAHLNLAVCVVVFVVTVVCLVKWKAHV